jgi:hypothetical protein
MRAHMPRTLNKSNGASSAGVRVASAVSAFLKHCGLRQWDGLKKRLESADGPARAGGSEARFVELIAPRAVGICECIVELENARGAKMRIQLKGVEIPDLASLSSVFLNGAS